MPNIKTFDAPQLGLNPTETGIQANTQAAYRAGRFFNQQAQATEEVGGELARGIGGDVKAVGDVALQYMEHREISHGAAAYAQLNDDLTQQWNDTAKNADPNDPTVAAKFREQTLEPALEKYRQNFLTEGGQKFAEARVDSLRNHMFEKTSADMSSLAKDAVAVNVKQTANSLSNTAMTDPSAVPHLLDSADGLVGGMVSSAPNIKGADSARARMQLTETMKESIVKAGAVGAIQNSNDPEGEAARWGAKYPNYINGAELKQLGAYAKSQQRANLLTEKQLQQFQKQQETDAAHKELSKTFTDSVQFDENGNVSIKPSFYKDIMKVEQAHPGVATERAKAMINFGEAQTKEKREIVNDDPDAVSQLYTGLFDQNKPTTDTDILRAAVEKKLSPHTQTTLLQLEKSLAESPLKGPIWQDTMAAAKDQLVVNVPGIPGKDNVGISNFAKFAQMFIPDYLAKKRSGTLPPNALDVNDPQSMISQAMAPFKRTQSQRLSDFIAGAGGLSPSTVAPSGGRRIGDVPVPAMLNGIAALQYNKQTGQWRDQVSGKIYDREGNEVGR